MLLVSPVSLLDTLFDMVARLALQDSLYVLDGGNSFQGYSLACKLRQSTPDVAAPMQRVMLSRAFTCYQMAALLEEGTFSSRPILVLDFLSTFYDQGVRVAERRRLLHRVPAPAAGVEPVRAGGGVDPPAFHHPRRRAAVSGNGPGRGRAGVVSSAPPGSPGGAAVIVILVLFGASMKPASLTIPHLFLYEQETLLRFRRALRRADQYALDDLLRPTQKQLAELPGAGKS